MRFFWVVVSIALFPFALPCVQLLAQQATRAVLAPQKEDTLPIAQGLRTAPSTFVAVNDATVAGHTPQRTGEQGPAVIRDEEARYVVLNVEFADAALRKSFN